MEHLLVSGDIPGTFLPNSKVLSHVGKRKRKEQPGLVTVGVTWFRDILVNDSCTAG